MKREKERKEQYDSELHGNENLSAERINTRQVDTFLGIAKGLIADGVVVQSEPEFLLDWLQHNEAVCKNPIISKVDGFVRKVMADGVLDEQKSKDLFDLLSSLVGDSKADEVFKSTSLPLTQPAPKIIFKDKEFLFTGTFACGTRKDCCSMTEALGGIAVRSVTNALDYLVIGKYVTESWKHESFGLKIENAMTKNSKKQANIAIVSEEHWLSETKRL